MQEVTTEKTGILDAFIGNSEVIAIVSHTHPDGDAIGSCLAFKTYLENVRHKTVRLFLEDNYSSTLSFLLSPYELDEISQWKSDSKNVKKALQDVNMVICLDCNGLSRTAGFEKPIRALKVPKVLIDHHLSPVTEEFDLCFSGTGISSASELAYQILKTMPDIEGDVSKLPDKCLRAILTGITTDTNNFANSVFPSTLESVSELLASGVDRDAVLTHIYNEYPEGRLRLIGYLLDKSLTITPEGVAYMILTKKMMKHFGISEGDTEGIVNMPLSIKNVKMSIFLKEDIRHFRVSLRSKKGISANRMAIQYFHGGGHEQAAGGKLNFPKDILVKWRAASYIEKCAKAFFENE